MAKVIGNNFVRLYDEDAIELALDNGKYVQLFYNAEFSKVILFGAAYKVVESVYFSQVIMLDEYGEIINNDDSSCYEDYKNVAFDVIFHKINSYDYQNTYKTFSKDYYNDMITS